MTYLNTRVVCLQEGLLLLVHGEVTDSSIDFFDREAVFIERHLKPLLAAVPELRVSKKLILLHFIPIQICASRDTYMELM